MPSRAKLVHQDPTRRLSGSRSQFSRAGSRSQDFRWVRSWRYLHQMKGLYFPRPREMMALLGSRRIRN
jgi:hypothetical protein